MKQLPAILALIAIPGSHAAARERNPFVRNLAWGWRMTDEQNAVERARGEVSAACKNAAEHAREWVKLGYGARPEEYLASPDGKADAAAIKAAVADFHKA